LSKPLKLVPAEINNVTASAFVTTSATPSRPTVPPSARTRTRASNVMPSAPGPSS
jgi:hypothetical protein